MASKLESHQGDGRIDSYLNMLHLLASINCFPYTTHMLKYNKSLVSYRESCAKAALLIYSIFKLAQSVILLTDCIPFCLLLVARICCYIKTDHSPEGGTCTGLPDIFIISKFTV